MLQSKHWLPSEARVKRGLHVPQISLPTQVWQLLILHVTQVPEELIARSLAQRLQKLGLEQVVHSLTPHWTQEEPLVAGSGL